MEEVTPPNLALDTVVEQIYISCDPNNTNSVPVSVLVEYVKPYFSQNLLELAELEVKLDPDRKDVSLSREAFYEAMKEWMNTLKPGLDDSFPPTCPQLLSPIIYQFIPKMCSTPTPFNESVKEYSSVVFVNSVSDQMNNLVNELQKAKHEYEMTKEQLLLAEEHNESLLGEFNRLKSALIKEQKTNEQLRKDFEDSNRLQEECDVAQKTLVRMEKSASGLKKDCINLKTEIDKLEDQKFQLEARIEKMQSNENKFVAQMAKMQKIIDIQDAEVLRLETSNHQLQFDLAEKTDLLTFYVNKVNESKKNESPVKMSTPKSKLGHSQMVNTNLRPPYESLMEELKEYKRRQDDLKEDQAIKNTLWNTMRRFKDQVATLETDRDDLVHTEKEKVEVGVSTESCLQISRMVETEHFQTDESVETDPVETADKNVGSGSFQTDDKDVGTDCMETADKSVGSEIFHSDRSVDTEEVDLKKDLRKIDEALREILANFEKHPFYLNLAVDSDDSGRISKLKSAIQKIVKQFEGRSDKKSNFDRQQIKIERLLEKLDLCKENLQKERDMNSGLSKNCAELERIVANVQGELKIQRVFADEQAKANIELSIKHGQLVEALQQQARKIMSDAKLLNLLKGKYRQLMEEQRHLLCDLEVSRGELGQAGELKEEFDNVRDQVEALRESILKAKQDLERTVVTVKEQLHIELGQSERQLLDTTPTTHHLFLLMLKQDVVALNQQIGDAQTLIQMLSVKFAEDIQVHNDDNSSSVYDSFPALSPFDELISLEEAEAAYPNQKTFLDSLTDIPDSELISLSPAEMEEKFSVVAVMLAVDFKTCEKRLYKQKVRCDNLLALFFDYLNSTIELLKYDDNEVATISISRLESMKDMVENLNESTRNLSLIECELRTMRFWNMVTNYVAHLNRNRMYRDNNKASTDLSRTNRFEWSKFLFSVFVCFVVIGLLFFVYLQWICSKEKRIKTCPFESAINKVLRRVFNEY